MHRPRSKKMVTRLRNLVKQHKSTSTPLHGNGKTITGKTINSLQNFCGIVIKQNCDNIFRMRKVIGAMLWHCVALHKK